MNNTRTATESKAHGGVISASSAMARTGNRDVFLISRVSTGSGASSGKLREQADWVEEQAIANGLNPVGAYSRATCGRMDNPDWTRILKLAIEKARKMDAFLLARDLGRYIRSEFFDHKTNVKAWPLDREFDALYGLHRGEVFLATLWEPSLREDGPGGIRSLQMEGRKQRPRRSPIFWDKQAAVFILMELTRTLEVSAIAGENIRGDWSMDKLGKRFGYSKRQVQKFWERYRAKARPVDAWKDELREAELGGESPAKKVTRRS